MHTILKVPFSSKKTDLKSPKDKKWDFGTVHSVQFWHFPAIFVLLKVTYLVTLFDHRIQVFKNSQNGPFLAFSMNFCPLKT